VPRIDERPSTLVARFSGAPTAGRLPEAIRRPKVPRTRWLLYGLRSRPGTVFVGRSVLSNRATDRAEDAPGPKLAVLAQAKVRGRNRITGNRSARSRPLAPSQPPPRIAIASDVPPRGRKFDDLHAQGAVQSIGHTVVPESGRAYISLPIATQAAAYKIVSAQNAAEESAFVHDGKSRQRGASISVM